MAAASRWFLVERTRDKGASSRPAVAGNGANKKKFEPVATSTPRQRINVQPAVSWVASANGIHHVPHMNNGSHGATQRAQQQQALQQKIGNYYSRAARPTESGGEAGATSREKRINIDEKRGTLKFAVKDCKPDEQASQLAHDSQGTGLKSRKNSSAMSPTAKPANGNICSYLKLWEITRYCSFSLMLAFSFMCLWIAIRRIRVPQSDVRKMQLVLACLPARFKNFNNVFTLALISASFGFPVANHSKC